MVKNLTIRWQLNLTTKPAKEENTKTTEDTLGSP